jgi:hypothetical protein
MFAGDLEVFRTAKCERLTDLLLHFTAVFGDFRSVSSRFCPRLATVLLQGTDTLGDLDLLPALTAMPDP